MSKRHDPKRAISSSPREEAPTPTEGVKTLTRGGSEGASQATPVPADGVGEYASHEAPPISDRLPVHAVGMVVTRPPAPPPTPPKDEGLRAEQFLRMFGGPLSAGDIAGRVQFSVVKGKGTERMSRAEWAEFFTTF